MRGDKESPGGGERWGARRAKWGDLLLLLLLERSFA